MQIKKTNANTTVKVFHPQQILVAFVYFTISANSLAQFWERHFLLPENGETPLELEE